MSPIRSSLLVSGCLLLTACGSNSVAVPSNSTSISPTVSMSPVAMTVSAVPTPSLTPTMNNHNPVVTLNTSMGTITMELYADKAPKTVANFVKLAKDHFYDGVLFHRVIPGFMAQTGDPNTKDSDPYNDGMGGPGYKFNDEFAPGLTNSRGVVAMANSGPNTNGSQFFINVVDNTYLDNHYSIFGHVTGGMDVVDKIVNVPTVQNNPRLQDRPVKDIKVTSVTVKE